MFALGASPVGQGKPADDPLASLVAAERDFAADAARIGINPAFRAHAASDSILLRPDPRPALVQLAQEVDDPTLRLEWQPAIAAVSRSNDLGFTTGPYRMTRAGTALHGQFLTVWQRDGDGKWRWYLDHGLPPVAETRPTIFPVTVRRLDAGLPAARHGTAGSELAAAEDGLNAAIAGGDWGALVDALAEEGHVLRPRHGVMVRAEAARLLPGLTGFVGAERLGMRISAAGDLAASYGRLRRGAGRPGAHYVRIWRREAAGWRLLIDQLT
ncbi:MAG: nuclear transport factor 2 family protein [Sphingomonas sp.]|uniref:nuclear transport factor 2 family protein n=1 Tax=Sphingomonas sp. TaxID=28214 RepID=UPI002273D5A3|nr:nuclear transport factor 2 family protein [Sphingomonas sp.]MCX8475643.1 nuclear transport factor 2 family protein [Sphingomonas sp.]